MTTHAVFGEPLVPFTVDNDRVTVRPWSRGDLAAVEDASHDDFIPVLTTVPGEYTQAEGEAFILRQQRRLASGEGWAMAIADNTSGQAIGHIGLWISSLDKGRAEIGYWIAPSSRGQGFASDALVLVTGWAFEELTVARLSLFIEPWNSASIRTAERAAYQREGLLQQWEVIDGEPRDMWSYARFRDPDHRHPSNPPDAAEQSVGVELRDACHGDAAMIRVCVGAAYGSYVDRMGKQPAPMLADFEALIDAGTVRVAVVRGHIVGLIVMWPEPDHFYIDSVAALPGAQGTGVGAALLADAERAAVSANCSEIRLYTNEAMTENLDYYPRRGFVETHRGSDEGYRRVYFSRQLPGSDIRSHS